MPSPLLTTKLYIPIARPNLVSRPRLIEQLNNGLSCRFTRITTFNTDKLIILPAYLDGDNCGFVISILAVNGQ